MRTRAALSALPLLPLLIWSVPAGADQEGVWNTTYSEASPVFDGLEWQLNLNGDGWATMLDDPVADDLEYPYVQPPGTAVQCRVRAWIVVVDAVVDADGLLIGTTNGRAYGEWSDLSAPNVVNEDHPGGCGLPVWSAR